MSVVLPFPGDDGTTPRDPYEPYWPPEPFRCPRHNIEVQSDNACTQCLEESQEEQQELESIEAELARRELKLFIEKTWAIVEPDQPLVWNWHLDVLCKLLEETTQGLHKRLIINIPPGLMKSLLVSVFWPAWEWASNAKLRYLNASYSSHLTVRDNLRLRDIVTSEWYQKHYGVEFASDQNAKELIKTTEGGWRFATSVGGGGTGEHPDRIIIDDPHTAEQARSDIERKTAAAWFSGTTSTRGVIRDVVTIVIMQRLHMEDLSGVLLAKGGWEHVKFPMRYEVFRIKTDTDPGNIPDPRDPRREPGELLLPQLIPEDKVRQLEIDLGPYGTAGQLQQRPAPEGGGLFRREWFKFVEAAPKIARRARGWDTAGTEGDGDYTCGVKISEPPGPVGEDDKPQGAGLFYVEHVAHGQWGPAGVDSVMRNTAVADGPGCAQREEKEPGSSGKAVIEARLKTLKGYDYAGVQISGDKVTRVKPFRAQCEGGNVYLVRTGDPATDAWIEPYISELCNFPTGKNDDRVDGSSCAFNAVLLEPLPQEAWATW